MKILNAVLRKKMYGNDLDKMPKRVQTALLTFIRLPLKVISQRHYRIKK
jgi:hypothetical protein